MLGNPSQVDWDGFNAYVIGTLPQLQYIDGKEITKTQRITALQQLPRLQVISSGQRMDNNSILIIILVERAFSISKKDNE